MEPSEVIDNACEGIWTDSNIFIHFNKPLRGRDSKVLFRYVGRVSNGNYCFEALTGLYAGKTRVITEQYIKENLENYVPEIKTFTLYLVERNNASNCLLSGNHHRNKEEKLLEKVEIIHIGKGHWSISGIEVLES